MTRDHTDEDLMLMYRDGDASAFEILYQRHKGPVYRYILRHCGNTADAEELFQDVWMKLIHARERYEVTAKFTTYLYRIVHNHVIDHFRKKKSGYPVDCGEEPDAVPAPHNDQPELQVELMQRAHSLLDAVAALPVEQRQVFLLKEEGGMSIREIAGVLGVNSETVKSRMRYAVKKLRSAVGEFNGRK